MSEKIVKRCELHDYYKIGCEACNEAWDRGVKREQELREIDMKEKRLFKPTTVAELIEALQWFDSSLKLKATWEGTAHDLWIYRAADLLIVNAEDGYDYESDIGRT